MSMTEQNKKRQRFSENTESSGSKKFSVLELTSPVATMAQAPPRASPSPVATRTPSLASPSPVFKRKQSLAAPSPAVSAMSKPIAVVKPTAATVEVTYPVPPMASAPAAPNPVDTSKHVLATPSPAATTAPSPVTTRTPAVASPSPVVSAMSKPIAVVNPMAAMVAVTDAVPATASAQAAPNPVDTTKHALATPSPAATTAPNTVATRTPAVAAPDPVSTAKPTTTVKHEPEDGVVLEGDEQAVVVPAVEEAVILEVKKKWLHCPTCHGPLKPHIFMCDGGHAVCSDCAGGGGENKHCGTCSRAATYTYIPCMDGLVSAYRVPCPYKNFGCASSIAYHALTDHKARCAHAPCYCLECQFEGSPASLLRHFTDQSGRHRWPVEKIKYQIRHLFVVPASEHRCLLVAEEDGRVFLLAVGAGRGASGVRPDNIVCVRGNDGGAAARPLYTGVLWVDGPLAAAGHLRCGFRQKGDVANCGLPGEVDMEHGQLHAHVNPEMLHGESKEVHLAICITKFW